MSSIFIHQVLKNLLQSGHVAYFAIWFIMNIEVIFHSFVALIDITQFAVTLHFCPSGARWEEIHGEPESVQPEAAVQHPAAACRQALSQ